MKGLVAVVCALVAVGAACTGSTPMEKFVCGMVDAAEHVNWDACKADLNGVEQNFMAAINALKDADAKHDNKELIGGLKDLAVALREVGASLTDCELGEVALLLAELAAELDSGLGDVVVGVKIIIKGFNIYDDVFDTVHDVQTGNWKDAGAKIEDLIKLIAVDVEVQELEEGEVPMLPEQDEEQDEEEDDVRPEDEQALTCGTTPMQQFVCGMIDAAKHVNWKAFKNDLHNTYTALERSVSLLHTAQEHKSKRDLINGLKKLAYALREIGASLNDCELGQVALLLAKLAAELDSGLGEVVMGVKIIIKGFNIYDDVFDMVHDFREHHWKDMGKKTLDLIKIVAVADMLEQAKVASPQGPIIVPLRQQARQQQK